MTATVIDAPIDAAERIRSQYEAMVQTELALLARRRPGIGASSLQLVADSLHDLLESIVLSRVQVNPQAAQVLFGLEEA